MRGADQVDTPIPAIAVMGAGLIGRRHVTHVAAEARLAAIIDPDPDVAALAAAHSVSHFQSLDACLQASIPAGNSGFAIDGVVIATPTHLHADNAIACIHAGLPVLIEKPIASTLDEAVRIVDASDAHQIPVLIGHHRRYNALIKSAKDYLDSGELGRLVSAHAVCWLCKPDDYFDIPWRRTSASGPLLTNLIHDIDLMRYLCGEVKSVQAIRSSAIRQFEAEDTAAILLQFANGALGTMSVSDSIVSPFSWELTAGENPAYPTTDQSCYTLGGTLGSLSLPDLTTWHNPDRRGWYEPIDSGRLVSATDDPLALQMRHFIDVIRGAAPPLVSAREGLNTLQVLTAAKTAASTGTMIQL